MEIQEQSGFIWSHTDVSIKAKLTWVPLQPMKHVPAGKGCTTAPYCSLSTDNNLSSCLKDIYSLTDSQRQQKGAIPPKAPPMTQQYCPHPPWHSQSNTSEWAGVGCLFGVSSWVTPTQQVKIWIWRGKGVLWTVTQHPRSEHITGSSGIAWIKKIHWCGAGTPLCLGGKLLRSCLVSKNNP